MQVFYGSEFSGKIYLESRLQFYRCAAQSKLEPIACMSLQLPENIISDPVIIRQLQTYTRAFRMKFIYRIVLRWRCEGAEPLNWK